MSGFDGTVSYVSREKVIDEGTMHEGQDTCRPYIERDVAAELAFLKIAWRKPSVSAVVRELLRRYKQSKQSK